MISKPKQYSYCPLCSSKLQEIQLESSSKLACPQKDCSFVHYKNPIPVVAVIVQLNSDVILARNKNWPTGFYSIISGFIEQGEDPFDCAIRETKEELNLETIDCQFLGHYPFALQNQLILAYHIQAEGEICLNEELVDFKLIPLEKLKGWEFGTGLAVKDFVAKSTTK